MAITAKMHKLGLAARRLNDGSDRLNLLLSKIDSVLGRLMIGMEYVHPRPLREQVKTDDDGKRVIEMSYLAYTKIRGNYHLAVKVSKVLESRRQAASEFPGELTPLLEAPRQLRHAAIDVLPDLVSGLATEVDDVLGRMEERCDVASQLLDHLEGMLASESGKFDGQVPRAQMRTSKTHSGY